MRLVAAADFRTDATGASSCVGQSRDGAYIDRTTEPGATLGFHAPYVAADSLGTLFAEIGLEEVLGGSRESIALMIQELVNWNVDKTILAHNAYTASTPQ